MKKVFRSIVLSALILSLSAPLFSFTPPRTGPVKIMPYKCLTWDVKTMLWIITVVVPVVK